MNELETCEGIVSLDDSTRSKHRLQHEGNALMGSDISVGDIVEQARHYDWEQDPPVLVEGAAEGNTGTKWKVVRLGGPQPGTAVPTGWQMSGSLTEACVEVELVEGEHKQKYLDFKVGSVATRILQPGYIARLGNCTDYNDHFPHRGPLQQFYDEWRTVKN